MPTVFFSDNDAGTLADDLKAIGLAEVLFAWLRSQHRDADRVQIDNCGSYFKITLPSALEPEDIPRSLPFVAGGGQRLIKGEGDGFPYERERQKRADYLAKRKNLAPADRRRFSVNPDEFPDIKQLTPHRLLDLYIAISHFRATDAYNALLDQWDGKSTEEFHYNLAMLLDIFAPHPNPLASATKRWSDDLGSDKATATLLQITNPSAGKGGNAAKANALNAVNLDGFWLLEYLKFVGYFTIAAPVLIGDDRKTYVLRPNKVDLGILHRLMERFHEHFRPSTSTKSDILASLRFAETYVQYCGDLLRDQSTPNPLYALFQRMPPVTDISTGFDLAAYKSMGNAFATMNLSTLNLPNWLTPIDSEPQARHMEALLEEHITVVRSMQNVKGEEGSEEFDLLRRYRDFLSGHDTLRFFEFAAHFGDYYLNRRHRSQWVVQFTTEGMETLMAQGKDAGKLSPILTTPGFIAIARAIRHATVLGQYYAAQRELSYPYEVRYGLGQDLLRTAAYPDTFIAELSGFLQSYNAENARIEERITKKSLADLPRHHRSSISTTDIDDMIRLVDMHGADIVCKLLVAYGYARDSRTQPGNAGSN